MKPARLTRLFVLPVALALTTLAAHADTFDWTISGPAPSLGGVPQPGSGTLTASLTGGEWVVSAITGTFGTSMITGLSTFQGADNLLFPTSTLLDTKGLSFTTASGTLVNLYSFFAPGSNVTPGNNYGEFTGNPAGFGVGTFTLTDTTSPVPEPSTFAMLGTGLLGAAGAIRRRLSRS